MNCEIRTLKRSFLRVLLALATMIPAILAAQSSPAKNSEVESRLALYEAEFSASYETVVGRTFKEQVRQLDLRYLQALDRALENATQGGLLEDALAFRAEKMRIAETTGVPGTDREDEPASLKRLRGTYRIELKKLAAERDLSAVPLTKEYDGRLEAYQTLLTTEGKLDDALRVKAARAKLAGTAPGTIPAAATPFVADGVTGWVVVFDGTDLRNWKPRESLRNFRVADGVLSAMMVSEKADYLYFRGTDEIPEILRNFELKATVQADPEANSGFYFHLGGEYGERGIHPIDGLEISLANSAKPLRFPTGTIYHFTPKSPPTLDQSQWFEVHFKVLDRGISVLLNGQPYLDHLAAVAPGPGEHGILTEGGKLAIQANSKDGAYRFKSIAIRLLE
jgi:hypothetical protein